MFLLIVFVTHLNSSIPYDYQSYEIGAYSSEQACMQAGDAWVKRHQKPSVQADFTCEKQIQYGEKI